MHNLTIRPELLSDYRETENMVREAFWDVYKPGCNEHLVLHKLRDAAAFVKELDLVACVGDKIVGNIVYSEAEIADGEDQRSIVLCMGPLSVLPAWQGKGIGSSLMKQSIDKARSLGYKAVVIFGDPGYYHRFGFKNAKEYNIQTPQGENFDAFMALELFENGLSGIQGKFQEDPVFQPENSELERFDKDFPYKEKHVTDTQLK